jgi:hypothetical protein
MAKRKFTAHVSQAADKLTKGPNGTESILRVRTIEIKDAEGNLIRTLESADNDADVREKITKSSYLIASDNGDTLDLTSGPMGGGSKFALGCLGLFLFAVLGIVVSCSVAMSNPANNEPEPPNEIDARIACHDLVSRKLKAPSTAEFKNETESKFNGTWTAKGTVDSENGFGAKIRGNYTCTMTFNPERDSFSGTVAIR